MDKRIVIIAAVIILAAGAAVFYFFGTKNPPPQPVALEFWNVFDDSAIWRPLIEDFKKQYPHISINYYKKNYNDYEKELVDALAAGRGPDIFAIQNTWLPKHQNKIYPAPEAAAVPAQMRNGFSITGPKQFRGTFVDVAGQDFIAAESSQSSETAAQEKIYGFPLFVDTMALFYNKDLLNSAGIATPPKTWQEFNDAVEKLTDKDIDRNISRAGAAIGTAKNINRSTDLLSLLMIQSGARMVSEDSRRAAFAESKSLSTGETFNPGERALTYYASFSDPDKKVYTWNKDQHYSLDAFVEGKAAMTFNYAYQIPAINARAPHLNFAITPIPQISLKNPAISYANYWAQTVSKKSAHPLEAWLFLNWLVQPENLKKYLAAVSRPASRKDLIDWQKADPNLDVFANQALTAKSWRQADNIAIETIFADMIEDVAAKKTPPGDALNRASQQVTILMSR